MSEQTMPFFTLFGAPDAGLAFARALGARRGVARRLPVEPAETEQPRFLGTERRLALRDNPLVVRMREGTLVQGGRRRRCTMIILEGPAEALGAACLRLAAAGAALPEPPATPPVAILPADLPPGAAFAHLLGILGETIRCHAAGAIAGTAPEPVHQMRVAVRRLRSAIGLFRKVAAGPALQAAQGELKTLMQLLGPARDWDVFLAGTGQEIAAALPDSKPLAGLIAQARRQRQAAYAALAAYLRGPDFRVLSVRLAWLAACHPWAATEDAPSELRDLAARMLRRRWARMTTAGELLETLPVAQLHVLRLHGKRMRYACEFFHPLFAGKNTTRWVRRLARLQERLGALNDAAVAASLVARLGPEGVGFAGGLVQGFVAAAAGDSRGRIARAWKRLGKLEPFWD